jgi:copper chaperone
MKFHVPDMSCGHCTAAITSGLKAADAQAEVETDLATRMVTVRSGQSPAKILAALAAAGYPAQIAP